LDVADHGLHARSIDQRREAEMAQVTVQNSLSDRHIVGDVPHDDHLIRRLAFKIDDDEREDVCFNEHPGHLLLLLVTAESPCPIGYGRFGS
jgi:hypothetical protein